ncbi:MAG: NAD+ synthase [Chloroflexota bacterium]|nr:NAD+ synthase [Chloroflexota bacterium]
MLESLNLDCERECERIVHFLRGYAEGAGRPRFVVGLSGGVDSSLATALAARAVGSENVKAIVLPHEKSSPESERDAHLVIDKLGLPFTRFEITEMMEPLFRRYPVMGKTRKGNAMARCRMLILYDQSEEFGGLVLGTSNRTEWLLGYFTLYGDGAAAIEPLAHLYKCQVRRLAAYVGIPEDILEKAPSADLWAGQTDEKELGFTYDAADQILYLLTERNLGVKEVVAQGFDRGIVQAVKRHMESTAFKRRLAPMLSTVHQER